MLVILWLMSVLILVSLRVILFVSRVSVLIRVRLVRVRRLCLREVPVIVVRSRVVCVPVVVPSLRLLVR